jgi:endoglucanase
VASAVAKVVGAAAAEHRVATLVAYAIPHRDCGGYSANSEESAAEYRRWVRAFVRGLGHRKAIIIVEPDALGLLSCLTPHQQRERLGLLRYATERFSAQGSWTYLDAGHSAWLPVGTAAARLRRAGIAAATGFSLNVAQFRPTGETTRYGTALAARVGGKHFVVDTSRNGVAPKNAQWCNPGGRGLGHRPTASTGTPLVDAYLWIKVPGESDGTCRKGPAAGRWFPAYAAMLVRNARL